MGNISGERSVEIDAPMARCYEIASDIENAPAWQGSLRDVEVLSRHADGRLTLKGGVREVLAPGGKRWFGARGDDGRIASSCAACRRPSSGPVSR